MAIGRPSVTVASVSILESGVGDRAYACGGAIRDGTGFSYTDVFRIGQLSPVETPIWTGRQGLPDAVPTAYTWNPALTDGLYHLKRSSTSRRQETEGEVLVRHAAFLRDLINSPKLRLLTSSGGRVAEIVLDPLMFELLLSARECLNVDAVSNAFGGIIIMASQGKMLDIEAGDRVALWNEPNKVRRDPQSSLTPEIVERILGDCLREQQLVPEASGRKQP